MDVDLTRTTGGIIASHRSPASPFQEEQEEENEDGSDMDETAVLVGIIEGETNEKEGDDDASKRSSTDLDSDRSTRSLEGQQVNRGEDESGYRLEVESRDERRLRQEDEDDSGSSGGEGGLQVDPGRRWVWDGKRGIEGRVLGDERSWESDGEGVGGRVVGRCRFSFVL